MSNMPNKNVRIFFDGLMVFFFQDGQGDGRFKECKIGILTMATGHEVKLQITRKTPSMPDVTTVHALPHDQIKHFKDLWLYLSQAGASSPGDSYVTRNKSFDQVFNMARYYDPKPLPVWEAMRPTLHITTGDFWAAILDNNEVCRLVDIEGVMSLYTPVFNANPPAVKKKLQKAIELFTSSHQEVGRMANVFWTDIAVGSDQRLVLAIGDENGPITELFSATAGAGETIEATLTNMPPTGDSAVLHAHQDEQQPDVPASPGDSHTHHADQAAITAKTAMEKEMNRKNYLKRTFHFLHYYDVLKFQPGQKQFVFLQDNPDWIDAGKKRGARPDPPCYIIEDTP